MGGVVKRPITAPLDLNAERDRNFLADMTDKFPLFARQAPSLRAMHDINGEAVIVGRLPGLRFAQTTGIQRLLFDITAIHAVREHRHTEFCQTLNKHPLKFEQGRVATGPVSTIVLTFVTLTDKE